MFLKAYRLIPKNPVQLKCILLLGIGLLFNNIYVFAQADSSVTTPMNEVVITGLREGTQLLQSPLSISVLTKKAIKSKTGINAFSELENLPGVHVLTPSLGFKVINARGFANTTNVRFAHLVDGIDNQAPHIGAAIGNALGAGELDIEKIDLVVGMASALYGMNAINGMVNFQTKNPFDYQGLSVQQTTGVNHIGEKNSSPKIYNESHLRFAKALNSKFAIKTNFGWVGGTDWNADNTTDLAASLNGSVGLPAGINPARDEVNGFGNESSNRRILTLNGKKYVVSRTGYREMEIDGRNINNLKGDFSIYFRPNKQTEWVSSYKGALINTVYQRSNRFRLQDYSLHQFSIQMKMTGLEIRTYVTTENTGKSYNIRSLAENMDKAFKSDNNWFSDFTKAFNTSISSGYSVVDALSLARASADNGRFLPGTNEYAQQYNKLVAINNWDLGAALRVQSKMVHSEAVFYWDKLIRKFKNLAPHTEIFSGMDFRLYSIVPDGNYFINPVKNDTWSNLNYSKIGGFTQLTQNLFNNQLKLVGTIRLDHNSYFGLKTNPRFSAIYTPNSKLSFRAIYQTGYRFPSIFEGFSNVNSGGVKRVGGLKIMSDGIFENSWTKSSIDAFQAQVNKDVNSGGLTLLQAQAKEIGLLKKNPYTYLQPEYVKSIETGFRAVILRNAITVDFNAYYNEYENFIAQMEASTPKFSNPDSLAVCMYTTSKQNRYRLWTNSKSKINTFGGSAALFVQLTKKLGIRTQITYSELRNTEYKDGLEDGFNTPKFQYSVALSTQDIIKNFSFSVNYRQQSPFNYTSFLATGVVGFYRTIDFQCQYNFVKQHTILKLGANNLLNTHYYSLLGGSNIGGIYFISICFNQ